MIKLSIKQIRKLVDDREVDKLLKIFFVITFRDSGEVDLQTHKGDMRKIVLASEIKKFRKKKYESGWGYIYCDEVLDITFL